MGLTFCIRKKLYSSKSEKLLVIKPSIIRMSESTREEKVNLKHIQYNYFTYKKGRHRLLYTYKKKSVCTLIYARRVKALLESLMGLLFLRDIRTHRHKIFALDAFEAIAWFAVKKCAPGFLLTSKKERKCAGFKKLKQKDSFCYTHTLYCCKKKFL